MNEPQGEATGAVAAIGAAEVRRVTWTGLAVNVTLAGLKLAAGLIGHSQVVVADAVHSLSDASTDVAVLIGVRYWSAPADDRHPYGHGRIETVVTALIALVLAGVAVGLGYQALATLRDPHSTRPGAIALAAALLSIVCKEALYRWSVAVGRRIKSSALVANAWHHRSDALSSLPAALAVAGARVHPSWVLLDHVGAVLVSFIILQAVWRIGWPAVQELVDTGATATERRRIRSVALDTEGVRTVHAVRTRRIGPGLAADLHVTVDGEMTVSRGHSVSEEVKRRLLADGPTLVDVVVHLEPEQDPGEGPAA